MSIRTLLYGLARRVFWMMPAVLRKELHGFRHALVRWARGSANPGRHLPGSMGWIEFRQGPLAKSDYRLIFIFEANLDWSITLYQRPHHLALALGRQGCLVIYKTTGDDVSGFWPVNDNVWLANDDSLAALTDVVRCFYSTSLFATGKELLAAQRFGFTIYEYIDHIDAAISGGRGSLHRLKDLKATAFTHADLVVSSAKILFDEANLECGARRSLYLPNGVDIHHYAKEKFQSISIIDELSDFRGRYNEIVGYFGAIAPWLWFELIEEVCDLLPGKGFVFIGPDYSGCVPLLPRRQNVLYLGAIGYDDLPAHADLFDVCFIPFVKGEVARATSPLKLFEYFALEKPVVVTGDMLECTAFDEVLAGNNANEIVECIEEALLRRKDSFFISRLRSLAEANSWDIRAKVYINRIESLQSQAADHC